jgi:heme-degrading monooxygenase HmoA
MPFLLVRHNVENWAAWKAVFDEHGATREAKGCKGGQVFRGADDPTEVTMILSWDGMDRARAFAKSADLKKVMKRAGVTGTPEVYFLDEAGRPTH